MWKPKPCEVTSVDRAGNIKVRWNNGTGYCWLGAACVPAGGAKPGDKGSLTLVRNRWVFIKEKQV